MAASYAWNRCEACLLETRLTSSVENDRLCRQFANIIIMPHSLMSRLAICPWLDFSTYESGRTLDQLLPLLNETDQRRSKRRKSNHYNGSQFPPAFLEQFIEN